MTTIEKLKQMNLSQVSGFKSCNICKKILFTIHQQRIIISARGNIRGCRRSQNTRLPNPSSKTHILVIEKYRNYVQQMLPPKFHWKFFLNLVCTDALDPLISQMHFNGKSPTTTQASRSQRINNDTRAESYKYRESTWHERLITFAYTHSERSLLIMNNRKFEEKKFQNLNGRTLYLHRTTERTACHHNKQ